MAGVVLSLVLAVALSAVQSFELFIDGWTPQLGESTALTLRVPYGPRIVRNQHSGGSNGVTECWWLVRAENACGTGSWGGIADPQPDCP